MTPSTDMPVRTSGRKYKLGLALSGGGARGFAHIGALKALHEHGIVPDIVAGVSAGSVVTILYASGIQPDDMLPLFEHVKFSDFAELTVPKDGFFKLDRFKRFIIKATGVTTFEQLKIPAIVCATDIDHSKAASFSSGPIGDAVIASCSIPIIFRPVLIGGVHYVDGGVLHNLPAWAIRDLCDTLIGINCSPLVKPSTAYKDTLVDIAHRSYNMLAKHNATADMKLCDLAVETRSIADYQVFNLKETKRVVHEGYEATITALQTAGWI